MKPFVGLLAPFAFEQGLANVAHVAEAGVGGFCEVGDAPCAAGIAKEDAQDRGGLGGEDRPQSPSFGLGPVRDGAVDVDTVEGEADVPDEIQVRDIMVGADRPGLGRQVRTHDHGDPTSAGVAVTGLASIRDVALELIDGRTDETGSPVRLDFDDERMGVIAVPEVDPCVYGRSVRIRLFTANGNGLETRHVVEQVTSRGQGDGLESRHRFIYFHHMMKIAKTVKNCQASQAPAPPRCIPRSCADGWGLD